MELILPVMEQYQSFPKSIGRCAFPENSDDEATVAPPVTAAPATSCKLGSRVTIPYNYENGAVVHDPTADGEIAIILEERGC